MRTIILLVILVSVVALAGLIVQGVRARQTSRVRASARWRAYRRADPATGDWSIGIELVAADGKTSADGTVLEKRELHWHPDGEDEERLLVSDAEAIHRAAVLNTYNKGAGDE